MACFTYSQYFSETEGRSRVCDKHFFSRLSEECTRKDASGVLVGGGSGGFIYIRPQGENSESSLGFLPPSTCGLLQAGLTTLGSHFRLQQGKAGHNFRRPQVTLDRGGKAFATSRKSSDIVEACSYHCVGNERAQVQLQVSAISCSGDAKG